MQPFKLRINWAGAEDYEWQGRTYKGMGVTVDLHVMGEEAPKTLRVFDSIEVAIAWAKGWLRDRGCGFYCDVDTHQRLDHKHITLHARPLNSLP